MSIKSRIQKIEIRSVGERLPENAIRIDFEIPKRVTEKYKNRSGIFHYYYLDGDQKVFI